MSGQRADLEFTCACCGDRFPFDLEADAAAQAEAEALFGCRGDAEDMAIVCDDCYTALMGFEGQPS